MSSLLAWVGVTLQRLYEIHGDAVNSSEASVLVLVDELDAHLHPEWQRQLVPTIVKHFPNLQIVATTHSPLIVNNLKRESILVARRDEASGAVLVDRPETDIEGCQAEMAYTSDLFGMQTTRPVRTVEKLDRYALLLNAPQRTDSEQADLETLREELFPVFRTDVPLWQIDDGNQSLEEIEAILASPDAKACIRQLLIPPSA